MGARVMAAPAGGRAEGQAVHAALCAAMAWLAVVLALPGSTFATSQSYRLMAGMGAEGQWAAGFGAVAALGFAGLLLPSRVLRLLSVLVLATAQGAVAGCFALSNPLGTASGAHAVLAALGYHLAWRRAHAGV